ncbi:MAG: hypothetical protein KAW12_06385 [Candidatus Aminicenantes bacterium]|nr:hypothetical protein [Candidatus Aminicenantes bacterium]
MLEIKNKKILKDGKPFRSITGDLGGCNTAIVFSSGIADDKHPWTKFGQADLNPQYKKRFAAEVKSLKGKTMMGGVFSGKLLTRASRGRDARGVTVWSPGHGAPGADNESVQATFFTNSTAIKMQRQLIDFVIDTIKKEKVDAVFAFLWESQVVSGNKKFLPWLFDHMAYVKKKAPWLPVGIHNHEIASVQTVENKIKDIFWFQEGDAWKDAHLDKLSEIVPGIVGHLNPGKFKPGKPWLLFKKGWQNVVLDAQESIRSGLIKIGTAGTLYKRWVNKNEASGDIDETHQSVLENYDFNRVSSLMSDFMVKISRELEKYKNAETLPDDFGRNLLWKFTGTEADGVMGGKIAKVKKEEDSEKKEEKEKKGKDSKQKEDRSEKERDNREEKRKEERRKEEEEREEKKKKEREKKRKERQKRKEERRKEEEEREKKEKKEREEKRKERQKRKEESRKKEEEGKEKKKKEREKKRKERQKRKEESRKKEEEGKEKKKKERKRGKEKRKTKEKKR